MRTKADKGEGDQFWQIFCGRPLWMTPYICLSPPIQKVEGDTKVDTRQFGHVVSAKSVLRCINHVQKSIFVFLAFVDLAQRSAIANERAIVNEQVERLVWMKLKSTAAKISASKQARGFLEHTEWGDSHCALVSLTK